MGIHIAQLPVPIGSGQGADQLKAVLQPAAQTSGVGADHQVELHRSKAQLPGSLQRVLAEAAADAQAAAVLRHHIAGIGDMGAEAQGVGPEVVAADHGAVAIKGHQHRLALLHPQGPGLGLGD